MSCGTREVLFFGRAKIVRRRLTAQTLAKRRLVNEPLFLTQLIPFKQSIAGRLIPIYRFDVRSA